MPTTDHAQIAIDPASIIDFSYCYRHKKAPPTEVNEAR